MTPPVGVPGAADPREMRRRGAARGGELLEGHGALAWKDESAREVNGGDG